MKNYYKILFVYALVFQFETTVAQNSGRNSQKDTTLKYYSRLANSEKNEDKVLLQGKLYQLLNSGNENDWFTASNYFYRLTMPLVSDSILKEQKLKFPNGMAIRNDEVKVVYDEKDAVKKEALYRAWVKKFPPQKFGTERIQYDYARNAVAMAFAKADNVKKALLYANMVETPVWRGEGWAGAANQLMKNNHLREAAGLFKKARDNSYKYMTTKRGDPGAGFAATAYVSYNSSLADILLRQKKYALALKYIREAHDSSKEIRGNVNGNYAKILMALGRNQQAFKKIDEAVKAGQATPEMKETLKILYRKVKGSNAGYGEYVIGLNKILADKTRKEIAKQMLKLPAPDFILKDVDGNAVTLSELKGKIVVLDFWATWCGPCKASFPAMKMAVNRFKDDPDVKFLFIHTWEHGDSTATQNAKKFVDANSYPFHVLMDLKEAGTGANKVVESFKVTGIPTKFVIDRDGNIRFKFTGFSGGNDAAVEEVSAMIELAKG